MNWLRQLFARRRIYGDLSEEIRAHLEEKVEELVAAGMPREEAEHAARRQFGNVMLTEQTAREVWQWPALENFWIDARYAFRILRKPPGFAVIAVLTLALGIGANTAIFSLIDAVMLRTLPVPNPQQLVFLGWAARAHGHIRGFSSYGDCPFSSMARGAANPGCSFSYPLFEQLRAEQNVFSGLSAFVPTGGWYAFVSGNFFSTLQVRPALGRLLTPTDNVPDAPPVAVLSYRYWQSHYGGNRSVVGKTMDIGKIPFTIVGVASSRFTGISPGNIPKVWLPLSSGFGTPMGFPKGRQTDPHNLWLQMFARLKPGVSMARAEAVTSAMYVRDVTTGSEALFKPSAEPRLLLASFARGSDFLRQDYSQTLLLLLIVTGIVLLLACANVAGLTLARSAARRKEVAIRLALGTSRWRLIRQLLTESLLLAAAGGALAILLAYWGASSVVAFLSSNSAPIQIDIHPDLRVLAFAFLASALAGILAGLVPALSATRVDLTPALKEAFDPLAGRGRPWRRLGFGSALVVAQVALSILVLAGAGLLVRSLVNRETRNYGFQTRNLLVFGLNPKHAGMKPAQLLTLYRQLRSRFASLPGVVSASYASLAPMWGGSVSYSYRVPGQPNGPGHQHVAEPVNVGPDFFKTLQIPIVAGRGFTAADFSSTAKLQPVIVDEALVKQAFGKENPLGHQLMLGGTSREVVGVVAGTSYDSPPSGAPPRPRLYSVLRLYRAPVPISVPIWAYEASLEIRTSGDPESILPMVREIVSQANGELVVADPTTVTAKIDRMLYRERLIGWLSSLFALLALLLACIGLYGLLAWEVARRTREIGIRMALGAERKAIWRMVLLRGAILALVGTVAGLALAFALTRLMQHFLFGVSATDPVSFTTVACLLLATALAACYFPALRAMRVDPMTALRNE